MQSLHAYSNWILTVTHGDVSCKYNGEAELYPFGFRVHAHILGKYTAFLIHVHSLITCPLMKHWHFNNDDDDDGKFVSLYSSATYT